MSEETHDRIVEAALRVLARDGYVATSIKDIAAEAGVAPGLLHYYFHTKEDLVLAALGSACASLRPAPNPGDPTGEVLGGIETFRRNLGEHRQLRTVLAEMHGVALHNPRIRQAVVDFIRADLAYAERLAHAVLAQREDRSPGEARPIAAAVVAALSGIGLVELLDPEFEAGPAIDMLITMALR